ncbi:MAG: 5'/3'-nucleotidase SurE [Saprospiraceae bacterium]
MDTPLILITNDDGMFAPGIKALVEVAKMHGEIVVVAPNSPQSGQGHAISLTTPLRLHKVDVFKEVEAYECSGTPADCVKLAKHVVLKDRNIDLCVSGINHGSNASINIIYSGTMSAAMEASLEGIKSIGFSLLDLAFEADFTGAKYYANQIIKYALGNDLGAGKLLNVNIPNLKLDEIKGIKICKQGNASWREKFQEGKDPRGETYYWLAGNFIVTEQPKDSDLWALSNGYVSVVPSHHDLTQYASLEPLKSLENHVNKNI